MNRLYRLGLWLRDPRNLVWTTPAMASALAVLLALAAAGVNAWVPEGLLPDIDTDTIDSLLTVIASSMLSVTTFSLGIMLSAFASATNGASPRATELVMGDDGTRTAISSFIAAFIYAIIAKTALGLHYYGSSGRFALFLVTLGVLVYLIVTLIRWVKTLSHLGRLPNTLAKLEAAAQRVIDEHQVSPLLGARTAPVDPPAGQPVCVNAVGYLTHIDLDQLEQCAAKAGLTIHIRVRPGVFVQHDTLLAVIEGQAGDELLKQARHAFVIGRQRSFDQDPRFGLTVLSEVAQRALSPAVNDPGTAIQVMSVLTRLILRLRPGFEADDHERVPERPHLTLVGLDEGDFIRDGFDPIARDGAGVAEVGIELQHRLAGIARCSHLRLATAARDQAAVARERSLGALTVAHDRELIEQAHGALAASAPGG